MPTTTGRKRGTPPASPPPGMPDDVPTLQTQLRLARAQNAYLHKALATALAQAPLAPAEGTPEEASALIIQDLRQRLAILKQHYAQKELDMAQLKYALAFAHKVLGWTDRAHPAMFGGEAFQGLDHVLLSLLTLTHPDRWSQGQPAAELAHELAVAITAQRATLTAR